MVRVGLFLFVAACWRSTPAPPAEPAPIVNKQAAAPPPLREPVETPMMAFERFTNDMCQCSTSECATQVSNDLTTWAQSLTRDKHDDMMQLDEAEQQRANELATRMGECMMKAMANSSSSSGSAGPMAP